MSRSSKYPLQPLLEHRERQVDDATAELGDTVRQREAAAQAKARAEQERQQAEARAAAVRADEASMLAQGELRVVDLARAEAWEVAAQAERNHHAESVEQAHRHLTAAGEAETQARLALAKSMADRDVVEKDKGRFVDRAARAVQAAEEEAAEEAWGGARGIKG